MEKARKNIHDDNSNFNPIVGATGGAVLGGLFGGAGTIIGLFIGLLVSFALIYHLFTKK